MSLTRPKKLHVNMADQKDGRLLDPWRLHGATIPLVDSRSPEFLVNEKNKSLLDTAVWLLLHGAKYNPNWHRIRYTQVQIVTSTLAI